MVESIGKTDKPERLTIKKVLNQLAISEMVQAVSQGDELLKIKAAAEFKKPAKELMATQDKVIEILRKLLDVARKAQTEVLAETPKRPTGNLPDDVKEKLEEAKAKTGRVPQAAEEGHRGHRRPGQDARRGLHGQGRRRAAEEDGGHRGRLVEVHEGPALRPEQAARPGLLQRPRWPRN